MNDVAAPAFLAEFCAENCTHVEAALNAGARRIELCDNLAMGGTSPSPGVIARAVEMAHARGARVMCMVRPRGGDFAYSADELDSMRIDARAAVELGADGVVFGCLAPRNRASYDASLAADLAARRLPGATYRDGYQLDLPACEHFCGLVSALGERRGRSIDITFHMAFDVLDRREQFGAIDALARLGVTRVLTHGGPAGTPLEDNLAHICALAAHAADRLIVLPGAGITYANAPDIASALDAQELHGTKIVDISKAFGSGYSS